MAIDRADDIGDQFPSDTGDTAPANPITNRAQVDYSTGIIDVAADIARSDDPEAVTDDTPAATGGATVFRGTLSSINDDTLTVINTDGESVFVAKILEHRKTVFDGLTVNGIQYEYAAGVSVERTATDANDSDIEEIQSLIPAFVLEFSEIYYVTVEGGTGVDGVNFIDLNVAGRIWAKTGIPDDD